MVIPSNWSIRRRLVLIVTGLTILLTLGVAVLTLEANTSNLRHETQARLLADNQAAANALDTELQRVESITQTFAAALEDDPAQVVTHARRLATEVLANEDFLGLRLNVYAPVGEVSRVLVFKPATSVSPLAGMSQYIDFDFLPDTWFLKTLEDGAGRWHEPAASYFPGINGTVVAYAAPFKGEDGTFQGVVWSEIPTWRLNLLLESAARTDDKRAYSLLLTDAGTPAATFHLPGGSGDTTETNLTSFAQSWLTDAPNGGFRLMDDPFEAERASAVVGNPLPHTGWQLISLFPAAVVQNPSERVLLGVMALTITGALLLGWVVYAFITHTVSKPLRTLGTAAQEIGSGDLRYQIDFQNWGNEIGRLAKALESMKTNLAHSYRQLSLWSQTLEQRVAQRTEELEAAQQQAQANAAELRAVYEASLSVVSDYQLEPILQKLMQNMLALLETSYCAVWLLTEDKAHLQLVATTAEDQSRLNLMVGPNEGLVGAAITQSKLLVAEDYAHWPQRLDQFSDPNVARAMAAPLMFYKRPIGAVLVGRVEEARPFSERDQRLLNLFANLVTPVVRNAQLFIQRDDARQQAERASSVKTRFLASVTHELRTPLNLIINNMDFMRIGQFGAVTPEQRERLDQTIRSAEHLLYLINDLLDVSKIEAGEMELTIVPADIQPVLEDALDSALMMIESKKTPITLVANVPDDLPLIPMDARRVRQVLTNLLSNAVKFTPEGSVELNVRLVGASLPVPKPVSSLALFLNGDEGDETPIRPYPPVEADTSPSTPTEPMPPIRLYGDGNENGGYLEISVRDSGIGIPPDEMGKLFEAFERSDRAKHMGIEGTGLGLPISRFLVEAHGGEMTVVSTVGKGSTFTFTLPLTAATQEPQYPSMSGIISRPVLTPPPGALNRRDIPDDVKALYKRQGEG